MARMHSLFPDRLLAPDVPVLQHCCLRNLLGQRKDQSQHMFGDHRSLHLPRVRDHHGSDVEKMISA